MPITCIDSLKNCYSGEWSYGEICVGCNCCGRLNKTTKWKARLEFHRDRLNHNQNFSDWIIGVEEIQQQNADANIVYHKKKIKECQRRILCAKK